MKSRIVIGIILIVLIGAGVLAWQFWKDDPAHLGEEFLERISKQDFAGLRDLLAEKGPRPAEEEFKEAYRRFADSFALAQIELVDFSKLDKKAKEAVFSFTLEYRSGHFPALTVKSDLKMERGGLFDAWKIVWADNLPLPGYGLGAAYSRLRLEARRANIYDGRGQLLAGEGSLISVGVQPDRITDEETLLTALQSELGLQPDYVREQYERPGVLGHWFVPLIRITEEKYRQVDPVLRPLPGIFFRREEARAYPYDFALAHISGYLGEVTAASLEDYPQRDYLSGEIVGRSGLEVSQDDTLRGRPGYRFYVEAGGERILISEKPVVRGEDIQITLDAQMQKLAFEVLGERAGAFVVLDGKSGAILTLASTPSYDPNEFSQGISLARWQELSTDLKNPMFNRALQGLYPPGSVFKIVTTAAALDQGLYSAQSEFTGSGELRVEGNIIRNYAGQVFSQHTLHTAIVDSINTTIAQVGLDLGAQLLQDYFQRWGLSESWPLGLPMQKGQLGNPARSKVGLAWSAIGQDQLLLTPLHLAQIFSVFANGGYLAPIHLLMGEKEGEQRPVLKTETVEQINAMLRDVVLEGTGQAAQVEGMGIFGKTGTAEVVGGGMHAWFAGHTQLPGSNPFAFAVLVEEGGIGGQSAAPLVREFFTKLRQLP